MKDLYPVDGHAGLRGVGNFSGAAKPASERTDALPASESKIEEMGKRAARGEAVFHKADAKPDLK